MTNSRRKGVEGERELADNDGGERMSNNNNLARERIEAAIELIEEQKEGADREYYLHDIGLSSSLDIGIYERVTDAYDTILAALDAVRWRSPITMPDFHDVLVAFRRSDGSVGCAITVKLEIPEYVTVLGWRPVLMWEEA
ncbi:MAG TPA: hypothetical protein GX728_04150 [Clostridiaceae bacterium]|nr:hypothetical protein [Clostridiaceae bacterium]